MMITALKTPRRYRFFLVDTSTLKQVRIKRKRARTAMQHEPLNSSTVKPRTITSLALVLRLEEPERWSRLALARSWWQEQLLEQQRCSRWCNRSCSWSLERRKRCKELEQHRCCMELELHSSWCVVHSIVCELGGSELVGCSSRLRLRSQPKTRPRKRPTNKMLDSYLTPSHDTGVRP